MHMSTIGSVSSDIYHQIQNNFTPDKILRASETVQRLAKVPNDASKQMVELGNYYSKVSATDAINSAKSGDTSSAKCASVLISAVEEGVSVNDACSFGAGIKAYSAKNSNNPITNIEVDV